MKTSYRKMIIFFWVACQVVAFSLLFPTHVYADDCLTDPLNAADCMRTGGFRQGTSVVISVAGTLATILVTMLGGAAATAQTTAGAITGAAATAGEAIAGVPTSATDTTGAAAAVPKVAAPGGETPPEPGLIENVLSSTEGGLENLVDSPWWDLTKNIAGPGSTIIGSLSEFFDFKEGAETVRKLHEALRAWQNNPTKEAAEKYLKNLRGTTNVRLQKLGGTLDLVSKGVDLVDAVGNGLKKADERGFTGVDKALTVGAEAAKKGLTWMLTKNPVVGLVDSALGGATEMAFGKDNRIDIGSAVDKGADAWDKTTQEYFNNTQGVTDADAKNQVQDNFLRFVRRIKGQVDSGQISGDTGSARVRHLHDIMLGGE